MVNIRPKSSPIFTFFIVRTMLAFTSLSWKLEVDSSESVVLTLNLDVPSKAFYVEKWRVHKGSDEKVFLALAIL